MRPIGLVKQDVGPSGVATGRGAFRLSSPILVGDEENPYRRKFHIILNRLNIKNIGGFVNDTKK